MGEEEGDVLGGVVMIVEATEDEAMFLVERDGRIVLGLCLQYYRSQVPFFGPAKGGLHQGCPYSPASILLGHDQVVNPAGLVPGLDRHVQITSGLSSLIGHEETFASLPIL